MGDREKKIEIAVGRKPRKNADKLEYLIDLYYAQHPDEDRDSVRPDLVADWACETGRWDKPPATPAELLRRELARHLRNSYFEDKQGRTVRANHPVFIEVLTADGMKRRSRWLKLYSATPEEILTSAQLRRNAALADVQQLELDLSSYDDNNEYGATLPKRNYNFDIDIEEKKQSSTYNPAPIDDDEDDNLWEQFTWLSYGGTGRMTSTKYYYML